MGMLSGAALSSEGDAGGSMGVDFGDYDHDGRLGHLRDEFRRPGRTTSTTIWARRVSTTSAGKPAWPAQHAYVTWGTGFFDFDNDGWVDLFVANGHVYPQMDILADPRSHYKEPLLLHMNNHDGTFDGCSTAARDWMRSPRIVAWRRVWRRRQRRQH